MQGLRQKEPCGHYGWLSSRVIGGICNFSNNYGFEVYITVAIVKSVIKLNLL